MNKKNHQSLNHAIKMASLETNLMDKLNGYLRIGKFPDHLIREANKLASKEEPTKFSDLNEGTDPIIVIPQTTISSN